MGRLRAGAPARAARSERVIALRVPAVPAAVLSGGLGLLLIGLADLVSRRAGPFALPLFWAGVVVMVGVAGWLLLAPAPSRVRRQVRTVLVGPRSAAWLPRTRSTETASVVGADRSRTALSRAERVAVVVLVAIGLYAVKVMTSPTAFVLPDEFSHLRTLEDILRSGHLFSENPLLPISSIYPGLEAAMATLTVGSGIAAFPLGVILIAAARIVGVLAVFLIAEGVIGSARGAGVASLIYMANPSFLMFDSAFSYESLALPLALVALWATFAWQRRRGRSLLHVAVLVIVIAALAATHHVTTLALAGFLAVWAIVATIRDGGLRASWPVAAAAAWTVLCGVAWLVVAGTAAISYLSFVFGVGFGQVLAILAGTDEAKRLFAPSAGFSTPLPEEAVAYLATGLVVLAGPFALLHALRSHRPSSFVVALALAALLYPAALALRFTAGGSEVSQRATEFLFLPIGILGADWLVGFRFRRHGWWHWRPTARPVVLAVLVILVAGGIVVGSSPAGRLPGPYHVAAEMRSIEPEGRALASWALELLGPDQRLIADRTNAKLLGSAGLEDPVMAANSHLGTAWVVMDTKLSEADLATLRDGHIDYVVVDLRLAQAPPVYPYYFEQSEPDGGSHTTPVPLVSLQKFDSLPGVLRIYDSGNIIVYDVRGLTGGSGG
ncbi:MAG TPA: hypothetical protein VFW20_02720 [Candidatus Limnocylindrales bacterium]|nr:hypothetical protein [Candidatus Limnocylindrales bacterium]